MQHTQVWTVGQKRLAWKHMDMMRDATTDLLHGQGRPGRVATQPTIHKSLRALWARNPNKVSLGDLQKSPDNTIGPDRITQLIPLEFSGVTEVKFITPLRNFGVKDRVIFPNRDKTGVV